MHFDLLSPTFWLFFFLLLAAIVDEAFNLGADFVSLTDDPASEPLSPAFEADRPSHLLFTPVGGMTQVNVISMRQEQVLSNISYRRLDKSILKRNSRSTLKGI